MLTRKQKFGVLLGNSLEFYDIAVERELKMVELKKEIKRLKEESEIKTA